MITLRKITLENRRGIFNLEVSEEQRRFVHPIYQAWLRATFLPRMEDIRFRSLFIRTNSLSVSL